MADTPRSGTISTRQQTRANRARQAPELSFTALHHHLDLDGLREAYRRTRKDGAVGIDGQTAEAYADKLEGNLQGLLDRAKSGQYRAPAVRRVHMPKGDGTQTRPLGIPTFEDKILQRAVAMVLEPIDETDVVEGSYGFRPGRSAHQARSRLREQRMGMGGGWGIDVDIRRFFDTLDHGQRREMVRRRVRDGVLLRLIGKWLHAGVLEAGTVTYPEAGTPQGGVISPLLANIDRHHVVDTWCEEDGKPRLRGRAFLVRYADDLVIGCEREDDARRVTAVLPKRFGKYGLTLHPEKTRLVDVRRPKSGPQGGPDAGEGSFDLRGFRHHWAKSRRGYWVIKQRTATDRFSRTVKRIGAWCREHRHDAVASQHEALSRQLRGHSGYYGITGNSQMLGRLVGEVKRRWRYWRNRRSQRGSWTWERFGRYLARKPLPPPIAIHSLSRAAAKP